MDACMGMWVDECMDFWLGDGWMGGWMDEEIYGHVFVRVNEKLMNECMKEGRKNN